MNSNCALDCDHQTSVGFITPPQTKPKSVAIRLYQSASLCQLFRNCRWALARSTPPFHRKNLTVQGLIADKMLGIQLCRHRRTVSPYHFTEECRMTMFLFPLLCFSEQDLLPPSLPPCRTHSIPPSGRFSSQFGPKRC